MLEYPNFVYLDVEKTGSTFIRNFLITHAAGNPVADDQHARVRRYWRGNRYYFSSCREPLDQYRSLYAYGCDGKGGFFARQQRQRSDLLPTYDGTREGFHRWLRIVLSKDRKPYMTPSMQAIYNPSIGLTTSRFLKLNLLKPKFLLGKVRSKAALGLLWRTRRLSTDVVRQERLREDLSRIVAGPLASSLKDPAAALDDLSNRARENTSSALDDDLTKDLPPDLRRGLDELEWFHYRHLGYAA